MVHAPQTSLYYCDETARNINLRAGAFGGCQSSLFEPTHLIHLALAGDLVVVTDLIHAYDLAQDCGELVEEGLRHVLEVAAGTKQRGKHEKKKKNLVRQIVFLGEQDDGRENTNDQLWSNVRSWKRSKQRQKWVKKEESEEQR